MELIKPVIVPYTKKKHKGRTKYVARCGRCGNEVEKITALRFCKWCGCGMDWSSTPYYTRYTLTESAIEWSYDKI